jgi:hypothetical protein
VARSFGAVHKLQILAMNVKQVTEIVSETVVLFGYCIIGFLGM